MPKARIAALVAAACFLLSTFSFAQAQTPRKPMITTPVDSRVSVVVPGSKHALAQPRFDAGAVDPGLRMNRVILALSPSTEAKADLQAFLDRQQDKSSADYHHWLTPEEFGTKYGPAPEDIQAIKSWLQNQGIQVTNVAKSGLWMELSGTSGQMEAAFKTQMRQYKVNGETHIANASELSIPAALAPAVSGVVSLHNFFKKPLSTRPVQARANGNGTYSPIIPLANLGNGTVHALTPGDYANIYDLNPLYVNSLNGAGIQLGLVARSDVSLQDYADFRSLVNVTGGTITNVVTVAPDPGFDPNDGDSIEATLDAQWAGGVARAANIQVLAAASTATTDGVDLSAAFAVDQNQVDVLSASFGQCESGLGPTEDAFFNSLWEQAAAQGISVFVSSGDNGAAACDAAEGTTAATHGLAVSGLASTPFNTAVGGTEFADTPAATFWSATNAAGGVSALGYIPETVWNETCTPTTPGSECAAQNFFSLESSSGGKSTLYPKPTWQTGLPASPADTSRDLPDVSLTAAGHDGYILCLGGSCSAASPTVAIVGGTSGSSPSFAGIMAIVDQVLGGRQGLANYALYRIAAGAGATCSSSARTLPATPPPAGCVFNDVTVGNNSVPGQAGFNATTGYDLATGLGSVNAANLVTAWQLLGAGATTTTALTVNGGTTTVTAAHGTAVPVSATVSNAGGAAPTGAVGLVSSTAGSFEALPLAPGAGGTSTAASNVNNLPGGTYTLTAHYPGDSVTAPSDSNAVTLTISPENSSTTLTSIGVNAQGFPITTTSFAYGDFMLLDAGIAAASTHGIATGTVSFKDAGSQISQGVATVDVKGEANLFFGVAGGPVPLPPGTHTLTAAYSGDASFNSSNSATVSVVVGKGNPTVAINPPNTTFVVSQPGNLVAAVSPTGPINATGTVQFLDGGVNLGTPATVSAGQATLSATFQTAGTHSITAHYSGDGTYNAANAAAISVPVAGPFSLGGAAAGGTSQTVVAGQTATYNLVASANQGGFTGNVTLACSGAPAGTTCTINPTSVSLSSTTTSVPFTVTVSTTTSASLHKFPFRGLPIVFASIFALVFAVKGNRKQLWQVAVVAVLALGISSCGGGGSSTPTPTPSPTPRPPTQSSIVVTGTSGGQTSTVTLSLTITH